MCTGPPRSCGTHRDDVRNTAVEIALVVLDGDGSVLFDPLHSKWAVQLRRTDMGNGHHGPPGLQGLIPHPTTPSPGDGREDLLTHSELSAKFINGADL